MKYPGGGLWQSSQEWGYLYGSSVREKTSQIRNMFSHCHPFFSSPNIFPVVEIVLGTVDNNEKYDIIKNSRLNRSDILVKGNRLWKISKQEKYQQSVSAI